MGDVVLTCPIRLVYKIENERRFVMLGVKAGRVVLKERVGQPGFGPADTSSAVNACVHLY